MQKFFINTADFTAKTLPPDLVYQASKVLRYQIGSQFIVGVDRKNYLVAITKINLKELEYQVLEELAIDNELDVAVTIIQGYPKGDKFEDIVKHGTELGASCFIPCLLERSQFKVEEKRLANKVVRFASKSSIWALYLTPAVPNAIKGVVSPTVSAVPALVATLPIELNPLDNLLDIPDVDFSKLFKSDFKDFNPFSNCSLVNSTSIVTEPSAITSPF